MPCLLTLPRELRDLILDSVIQCHTPVPKYSAADTVLLRNYEFPHYERFLQGRIGYIHEHERHGSNTSSLLLVNHQLHNECISRLDALKPAFTLNIRVVSESLLWPSWTCIPHSLSKNLEKLEVTVQAVGDCKENVLHSAWEIVAKNSVLGQTIVVLLIRFMRHGPYGVYFTNEPFNERMRPAELEEGIFSIKNIIVDIFSPDSSTGATGPRASADFIAGCINKESPMLTLTEGRITYCRLGKMSILTDGQQYATREYGEMLKFKLLAMKLKFPNLPSHYLERAKKGYLEISKLRRKAGMEAPEQFRGALEEFSPEELERFAGYMEEII